MNKIELINKELNKIDGLAMFDDMINPQIKPAKNTLFIMGKIVDTNFTCTAKEYRVFADSDLSIIL